MKRNKLLVLALLVAVTSFSACTNDAEEVLTQENEIKLTSEITASRVASLDYQSTQIVKGQQVGVTITGAKSEHNNIAWSVGDNGVLTNTSTPVYFGNDQAMITAYHPFNDEWNENKGYDFSVSIDQSTNAEYLASDLLSATATSSKTETAIPLTFSHKLTKVNVTLVPEEDDDDLNGATISIYNTKTSATFNPITGAVSAATGEPQEIIAGVTADDVYTASAIVIPQEVSGKFIKFTHEGKTYYYTLASGKTLKSGHSYSYTLTVKGKQLISTNSSINDWNDESDNTGDAEEEVVKIPNNQIWYTSINGSVIEPYDINVFGANIVSNVYEEGKGIITFDADITTIGKYAFLTKYSLESIIIPNSVIAIEYEAFGDCESLASVIIPNGVTKIGDLSFWECKSLKSITIPNSVTTIGNDAFRDCHSLAKVIIPNSVTTIGNYAFSNCKSLTDITIPNSVTTIGKQTFGWCLSLSNVIIPNSVTKIGDSAFWGCESLKSITIPNNVTTIGDYAFCSCYSLAKVVIKKIIPPTIYSYTFSNNSKNIKFYVPTESLEDYKKADYWKDLNLMSE